MTTSVAGFLRNPRVERQLMRLDEIREKPRSAHRDLDRERVKHRQLLGMNPNKKSRRVSEKPCYTFKAAGDDRSGGPAVPSGRRGRVNDKRLRHADSLSSWRP